MLPKMADLLAMQPYALSSAAKNELYLECMRRLCREHDRACLEYGRILRMERFDPDNMRDVSEIPFLPVRLFKEFDLRSVPREAIVKTMSSSGTSGQQPSRIHLDRENAANQTKALAKIMGSFLGTKRLPMLVLDSASTVKNRRDFTARGAGILGFSMFGRDITYALDQDMRPDMPTIQSFMEKYASQPVFIFGFTFMIWRYLVQPLLSEGKRLDMGDGILLHGGGWKKLADQAVTATAFREAITRTLGISRVHDYYGMVEQTGSIFMECEKGHLHASVYSDIIIRNSDDFMPLGFGKRGLVQLLSLLPTSYPGHSLLSEDEGEILGEDDCPCGRLGKYFCIHGRIAMAEARGCSNTFAAQ